MSRPVVKVLVKDLDGKWWLFEGVPHTDWFFVDKNINPHYKTQPLEDGTPILECNDCECHGVEAKPVRDVRVAMTRDGND